MALAAMEQKQKDLAKLLPLLRLPESLSEDALKELSELAQDWCAAHGLTIRAPPAYERACFPASKSNSLWVNCGCTVVPSWLPRSCYAAVVEAAPWFSLLVHRIATHPTFLNETLDRVAEGDEFTKRLLDIHKEAQADGATRQQLALGIHRNDFMIHMERQGDSFLAVAQQVEINAIASSFSHLGHLTSELHRYLVQQRPNLLPGYSLENMPVNDADKKVPLALFTAHEAFCSQLDHNERARAIEKVVLMVVQPGERNRVDQRHIEYALLREHGIRLVRCTLAALQGCASLLDGRHLALHSASRGDVVVSVVYFRAAYTPSDYPSEVEWEGRALLERSSAVKCPNIAYHLTGTKKVQQRLCEPGVLEQFFPEEPEVPTLLRKCFAGIYDLDRGGQYTAKMKEALENPGKFVMKPQREGGGTLIVGPAMQQALQEWDDTKLNSHILMERICPIPTPTLALVEGKIGIIPNAIQEFGLFQVFLGDGDKVIMNEVGGHLVRTKSNDTEDGGVAGGRAVTDSPYLVDL